MICVPRAVFAFGLQASTPTGVIHLDDYEVPTVELTKGSTAASATLRRSILVLAPKPTSDEVEGLPSEATHPTLRICADHSEELEACRITYMDDINRYRIL
jgi:hypothetical protein